MLIRACSDLTSLTADTLMAPLLGARCDVGARPLVGGWAWCRGLAPLADHRGAAKPEGPAPTATAGSPFSEAAFFAPRPPLLGLSFTDRPLVMGVLNVTPDSFSDGGRHGRGAAAAGAALNLLQAGADILDVGGESTRPGAAPTPVSEELDRVLPVIDAVKQAAPHAVISIDTRKAEVARRAFEAGARLFNDVSALTFDPEAPAAAAELSVAFDGAVCLMHAQGDPLTMQNAPAYADVTVDVTRFLFERVAAAAAAGTPTSRLIVDPGIGFGKTLAHNLTLLGELGALHAIGAPILLGASRKRFIGALSGEMDAQRRAPGSIAAALHGAAQGAQILRVHDVAETVQALAVWGALAGAPAGPTLAPATTTTPS